MREHRINIFISHSWNYTEHYDTLCEWIFDEEWTVGEYPKVPIRFSDFSVPRDDPIHNAYNTHALRRAIDNEIAKSHIVVIPTGMYANYSRWIEKEIDIAKRRHRPILAVDPWGQKKRSSLVIDNATANVGWRRQSVVDGIWNLYGGYYR